MANIPANLLPQDESLDSIEAKKEHIQLPKSETDKVKKDTRSKLYDLGIGLVAAGVITNTAPVQANQTLDNPNANTPIKTTDLAGITTSQDYKADLIPVGDKFEGPTSFDTDAFADILYLFDGDQRYARLKTRFIENFEALSPENRNKVIEMYKEGKKEQPDQLKLMKGMSAIANFLRGLEIAQTIIKQYTETGKITEDGDFTGIASGLAILEYFPTAGKQIIPFLNSPADVTYLAEQVALVYKSSAAKSQERTAKNREEIDKSRANIAEMEKRIKIMTEITNMINKALGK